MKDFLLITPPFTQLNTPYPATAYLKGFLNQINKSSLQVDLGIEVILALFNAKQLRFIFETASAEGRIKSNNSKRIVALQDDYIQTIEPVIGFLQGKNPTLARLICSGDFLPEASRLQAVNDLDWAFGEMGMQDQAKHLATLYLEDISDFIVECVDENFGFSRYAERLGRSANSFDEIYSALQRPLSLIDELTVQILHEKMSVANPSLVCFSVPFPGNLFSAFRCAQYLKKHFPNQKIAMGGGFPNTELRSLTDVRVFDFFDFITLDDGEAPIEQLFRYISEENSDYKALKRTFIKLDNQVEFINNAALKDYKQSEVGTPDFTDLPLKDYISVIEIANPMHSLWSDGRWNKLTMAHGCYWGKCSFCDVSLDYIKIYEPITARLIVDRMQEMMEKTGESGFHFVDEAAPPALMRSIALELIKRRMTVTWWANIRFEKSFTKDLCRLLKSSGCIAVSGGLEVASDRLLKLIEKGVTVAQVAQVTDNLTQAGIMVHAYLMYGYPTQTIQETIDSLEMVRQLFENGVLKSGFWHQFALTAHSPIGLNPDAYGIIPELKPISFANNDVAFKDKTNINHDQFSYGLKKSLYNYMHDIGFEIPLHQWFEFKTPPPTIAKNYIANCLDAQDLWTIKPNAKIVWLGNLPQHQLITKTKKKKSIQSLEVSVHTKTCHRKIHFKPEEGQWLVNLLSKVAINEPTASTFQQIKADFETSFEHFELFWHSKPMQEIRELGLLVL
ncbi:B12-binding domain-containing radical SAM protein [Acidiluteibacter ferrifornacis]|uniref:Radical SAM protein n=1 Tax=Acidiluteibacter ferrifornacis TaxID=2692424 RepID=A0A6N9NM22_9FLAO|nr:radical SAM protein [Acidiluteibacter ferrifornacis]NBG66909.1 radical SAM protein [Acidiluteibacter ferrifornacis]